MDSPSTILVGDKEIEAPKWQLPYGGLIINLYRHPRLLIPVNIDMWEREYEYAGAYWSAVPYLERHPCAIEAREIYEKALAIFRK